MDKWFICVLKDNNYCVWGYGSTRQEARKDAAKWIKKYYGDDPKPNLNTDLVVYEASEELHTYITGPHNKINEYVPLEIVNGKAALTEEARKDIIAVEVYRIMNQAQEDILKLIQGSK